MSDYSKILVADNASFIRMIVRLRLQAAGVPPKDILEAENGEEAYAILRKTGIRNVLSDYEMEPMDGITLAAKILNEDGEKDFRFVLFSGTPMERILAAVAEADVKIPILTKIQIRESWAAADIIDTYFPELARCIKKVTGDG